MTDDPDDLEPIDLSASPPPAHWPAGWYADPWTAGQYRYWGGQAWTGATHRWGPANAPQDATTAAWPAASSGIARGYAVPTTAVTDDAPLGPRRRRGPIVAIVIALVAVLVVSGVIGYAINANSQPDRAVSVVPPPSTTAPSTPTTTPRPIIPSRDPSKNVLGGIVVRQADVGSARTVVLYQRGNSLGDPTLDLCNGSFPSEALRTARLQLVDVDTKGDSTLSTEAVLYRSPDASAQAFTELEHVRAACPDKPVASPVDHTLETTRFQDPPDASWAETPGVQRLAYRMTIKADGQTSPLVTVYLRRGRAFLGLYFPQPDGKQPAIAGNTSIADIVALFESRLAKLPAGVVNARIASS